MPKIDTEAERERLDRIFDEIAGKMPEEPKKTQKEIDEENRRARIDRLSSQEPSAFIASVGDRIRTKAFKTDWEEILCRQYQNLFKLAKVPGYLNAEVNLYRHFVSGVIAELDRCTGLAKEHDNHQGFRGLRPQAPGEAVKQKVLAFRRGLCGICRISAYRKYIHL